MLLTSIFAISFIKLYIAKNCLFFYWKCDKI